LLLAVLATLVRAEDVLYLYIWNTYLSEDTVRRFETQCRCRLNQDFYSDNEEMLAKLEAGAIGYDLIVPTGNAVETLLRQESAASARQDETAESEEPQDRVSRSLVRSGPALRRALCDLGDAARL
jgi:hypothetical protein